MPVRVNCPACRAACNVPDHLLGRILLCPKCKKQFRAPGAASASAPAKPKPGRSAPAPSRTAAARPSKQKKGGGVGSAILMTILALLMLGGTGFVIWYVLNENQTPSVTDNKSSNSGEKKSDGVAKSVDDKPDAGNPNSKPEAKPDENQPGNPDSKPEVGGGNEPVLGGEEFGNYLKNVYYDFPLSGISEMMPNGGDPPRRRLPPPGKAPPFPGQAPE